jgi:hypothetical protein
LLFTAGDGTNKLAHEIESYTSASGALVAWVNVPLLSSTADTNIYLYYGNPAAANQQTATNVWDANFRGVWHLQQTAGNFNDSTAYGNAGMNSVSDSNKSGQIGSGQGFNGGGDRITAANSASLAVTQQITLSAWVNYAAFVTNNKFADIVGKGYDGAGDAYFLRTQCPSNSRSLCVGSYTNGGSGTNYGVIWPISGWNTNEWHYVVGLYDGANWTLYFDGAQVATAAQATGALSNAQPVTIGAFDFNGTFSRFSAANIDEVRISKTARSPAWIATEYANQSSPAAFCSLGSAQPHPPATNYFHFSATSLGANTGPVNPTNGVTSVGGAGLAAGDLVVFDGLAIDTAPTMPGARWNLIKRPMAFMG